MQVRAEDDPLSVPALMIKFAGSKCWNNRTQMGSAFLATYTRVRQAREKHHTIMTNRTMLGLSCNTGVSGPPSFWFRVDRGTEVPATRHRRTGSVYANARIGAVGDRVRLLDHRTMQ